MLMFQNNVLENSDNSSATWEIVIMLLVAFALGYLLRYFMGKSSSKSQNELAELEAEKQVLASRINSLDSDLKVSQKKNDQLATDLDACLASKASMEEASAAADSVAMPVMGESPTASNTSAAHVSADSEEMPVMEEPADTNATNVSSNSAKTPVVEESPTASDVNTADVSDTNAEMPVVEESSTSSDKDVADTDTTPVTTPPASADDLKLVEGIGPKIEGMLNHQGIYTFEQLANADVEKIRSILSSEGSQFGSVHDPSTWPQQAGMAARGEWDALKVYKDKLQGGKEV